MRSEISLLPDLLDSAAAKWPEKLAVSAGSAGSPGSLDQEGLTFRALQLASLRLASWLRADGVTRGERVAITSSADPVVAALIFAVARTGAAFTVLHEQVRGPALEHVLGDCQPRLLVGDDPDVLSTARRHGTRAVATAELAALARETPCDAGEMPGAEELPAEEIPVAGAVPVDPVCLIYTSGTTSLPKAVVSTHQQMLFAVRAIQSVLGYRPDDVVYCPLPLSFDYGLYQVFLCVASGAQVRLGAAADAGPALLRGLLAARATVLPAVPSVAESLAWLLKHAAADLPQLRLVTNTGAAISSATLAALRAALPGLTIQVMYGLTECKRATIMPPDGDLAHPGSSGLALPGTEIFAVDEQGNRLPPGTAGEIVVRGPNVMAGYWRRPDLTAQKFPRRDGLFPELRTGDYGTVDEEGYLYFAGRRDDQYKERGFRVSAVEVEAAAYRLPGVVSAAVLLPDGDRPATLVVVGDLTPELVLERMRAEIEEYKVPRRCHVLDELPLSQNGKVDRKALASLLSGALARS